MRKLAIFVTVALPAVAAGVQHTDAGNREEGARVDVTVSLTGFGTPAKYWQNPCDEDGEYSSYASHETYIKYYRDEATDIQISNGGFGPEHGDELIATYGADVFNTFVKTHTRYTRYCYDPRTEDVDPSSIDNFWVPLVTQQTVVAALWKHVWDYVDAPQIQWPSMDQEFGWLYVQTPMDFRASELSGMSLTATVTNVTGSVTATIDATPTELALEPGEPGGLPTSCPVTASTAPYSASVPGLCSMTYRNSSAISPTGTFEANASVLWEIDTTDPGFGVTSIRTWSWFDIAVAEAQAVVTG